MKKKKEEEKTKKRFKKKIIFPSAWDTGYIAIKQGGTINHQWSVQNCGNKGSRASQEFHKVYGSNLVPAIVHGKTTLAFLDKSIRAKKTNSISDETILYFLSSLYMNLHTGYILLLKNSLF